MGRGRYSLEYINLLETTMGNIPTRSKRKWKAFAKVLADPSFDATRMHGNTKENKIDKRLSFALDSYTLSLWEEVRDLPALTGCAQRQGLRSVLLDYRNSLLLNQTTPPAP